MIMNLTIKQKHLNNIWVDIYTRLQNMWPPSSTRGLDIKHGVRSVPLESSILNKIFNVRFLGDGSELRKF